MPGEAWGRLGTPGDTWENAQERQGTPGGCPGTAGKEGGRGGVGGLPRDVWKLPGASRSLWLALAGCRQ